tara:strand:- start:3932 stop:4126 length:195 start_codon:yes stop_codon:yes gene_type:complete
MINIGNIVYRKRSKGTLRNNQISKASIGLVIKEHKEEGAITQYYVAFGQDRPMWFYQQDLHKID